MCNMLVSKRSHGRVLKLAGFAVMARVAEEGEDRLALRLHVLLLVLDKKLGQC